MTVYLVLLGAITLGGFWFCERNPSRKKDLIFLMVCSLAMLIISSVRALTVGIDTTSYVNYFQSLEGQPLSFVFSAENHFLKEPGYALFNFLLSRISVHPMVLLAGISLLILILRAIFIWRYSSSVWISVFIFVSYGFFCYSICTYRQEIAISIALFALPQLQKKRLIPYLLILLLAATFHISVLFLIPAYLFAYLPINSIMLSLYGVVTVVGILFSEWFLTWFTQYVYKSYTLDNAYTQSRSVNTAFIPVLTMIGVLILAKKIQEYKPENKVLIHFICCAGCLFILTVKHFIFQRVALLFIPVTLLLLPELLASLRPNPDNYPELAAFEKLDSVKQKQQMYRYNAVKKRYQDDQSSYSLALGCVLVGGWVYYLFILVANRLNYVPYLLFTQNPESVMRFYTSFLK